MRQSPTHEEIHDKTTAHIARHRLSATTSGFRWPDHGSVKALLSQQGLKEAFTRIATTGKATGGKVTLAASVLGCLALATAAHGPMAQASYDRPSVAVATADRSAAERATRSYDRTRDGALTDAQTDAANKMLAPEIAKAKEEAARQAA